eukprot:915412-Pyramimonas_sp.AAC.1
MEVPEAQAYATSLARWQRRLPPHALKMSSPGAKTSRQGPVLDHMYISSPACTAPEGEGSARRAGAGSLLAPARAVVSSAKRVNLQRRRADSHPCVVEDSFFPRPIAQGVVEDSCA